MKNLAKLMLCLALFSIPIRMGFSRGDKIIPQVVAGLGWTTKFDLTNISPAQPITNMRLAFYHNDGTSWTLLTNQGTLSNLTLNLNPRQTLRVQAIGGSTVEAGYAIIYDEETGNSDYSVDYVLGISVFYQVLTDAGVTETVTVSVPQPTATATAPMEMNAPDIASGLAIVNWAGSDNVIQLTLYSEDGTKYGTTASFTLAAGHQRAEFLDQNLFPGLTSFKGMAEFTATGPIALLALRQTRAADGNPQYATLVPVDKESLRRDSYMVLLQAATDNNPIMPIDVDGFAVDFHRNSDEVEYYSWDFVYQYGAPNTADRYLRPWNGATIASLGGYVDTAFDAISLPDLKTLNNYSTSDIDLSGANLYLNFTFAIHTDLGNYAKARIVRIIDTYDGSRYYKDLVLEVVVYK